MYMSRARRRQVFKFIGLDIDQLIDLDRYQGAGYSDIIFVKHRNILFDSDIYIVKHRNILFH